jgi:hypothetical protein
MRAVEFRYYRWMNNTRGPQINGVTVMDVNQADPVFFCFTPQGRMLQGVGAAVLPMTGPLEIIIDRDDGEGVARRIFVPVNGMPRLTL